MLERLIWVVPLAVACLGAWRPRAGLLFLAAALPLFGSPPGGPYLEALDVAAVAAILTAWRAARARPSALTWPVAAFVVVSLATLIPSPYLPPSWRPQTMLGLLSVLPGVESWSALYTWRAAADLLLGWGLFTAVRRAFAGSSARPLALALAAGLGGALLVGLASQAGFIDLTGFRPQQDAGAALPRLSSMFFLSGWFSEYIVLAAPAAIAALQGAGRLGRPLTLPFAALALACLGLTLQRGGWAAALVQVVLWLAVVAWRGRGRKRDLFRTVVAAAVIVVLTLLLLIATGSPVRPLFERGRSIETGISPRMVLWTSAVEMARERPLLGWGLGSFAPAYDLAHPVGSEGRSRYRNTAHSLYLDVAAERGLLGLLALGILCWTAIVCLRHPRPGEETLAVGLALCLAGAAVYGLVQYLFHLRNIAWLLWILVGCVTLVSRREEVLATRRAALVLLTIALALVPFRVVFGEPPRYAGDRELGLHETETGSGHRYRWTEGLAATRLRRGGDTLILTLANGHPRAAERPVDVIVDIDGRTVARLTITGGWEEHSIELGPPRREWLVLSLRVRPTFRPFSDYRRYTDLERTRDIRSLGLAMKEPAWE